MEGIKEDQGLRLRRLRIGFPSQITANRNSQGEGLPLNGTCLRDKTNKLERAAVVNTSKNHDYLEIYMSNNKSNY
jgi:hypothetical protein